ncbi:hypothetical protein H9L39_17086 [Fusarium oxysporum f. sp. albedinis]|nr:hypothetical protein H9L39_17086 [Fusarium oxysporum f. sp. albedinis]
MSPEELPNLSTPRPGQVAEIQPAEAAAEAQSHLLAEAKARRVLPLSATIHHYQSSEAMNFDGPIFVHGRTASSEHADDLKQMKDQAARGTSSQAFPNSFNPSSQRLLPDDIPPRSATEPPQRSMQARNGPVIGLSATPRVMRLIIEGNHDQSGSTLRPDVPSIPAGFSQKYSPESSSQQSPEREAPAPEPNCQIFR